jgi:hypothetical protein
VPYLLGRECAYRGRLRNFHGGPTATQDPIQFPGQGWGNRTGLAHLPNIEWIPHRSPSTQPPQSANAFQEADQADRGEHKEVRLSKPCARRWRQHARSTWLSSSLSLVSAGLFVERIDAEPVPNHLAQTSCHIACRRYTTPARTRRAFSICQKVKCLTLVSRYSGALAFSGALGFSAMLRYAIAGQDNALGSSVATLTTNCDAGPVLQFALIVGASSTPTPTR